MSVSAPGLTPPPSARESAVWTLLGTVKDPEIPVLNIIELGVVRYVRAAADGAVHVGLTPTYSGCPATDVIRRSVASTLAHGGIVDAIIETVLAPAWTSDWITAEGRSKLAAYGIAPPLQALTHPKGLFGHAPIACPRCASVATRQVSAFGSTPCKAHYLCTACLEPFDYFKCI